MRGHSPLGKAQEHGSTHGEEQGVCFVTHPGGLVALVPMVIALKPSLVPASVGCFGTLSACSVILQVLCL